MLLSERVLLPLKLLSILFNYCCPFKMRTMLGSELSCPSFIPVQFMVWSRSYFDITITYFDVAIMFSSKTPKRTGPNRPWDVHIQSMMQPYS